VNYNNLKLKKILSIFVGISLTTLIILLTTQYKLIDCILLKSGHGEFKPINVMILFVDDQREDTISALGNKFIKTPNLDTLVESGFVFRNAYCMGGFSAAVCLPSRMMLLRGRSWFSVRDIPVDAPNLAKSMNEAGYVSYHYGKHSNVDKWTHRSFTHSHYINDGQVRRSGHPGEEIANEAIKFMKERDKSRPFFMYLAFAAPHDPWVATEENRAHYDLQDILIPQNFLSYHPFDNGEMFVRIDQLSPWPRTEGTIRKHLRNYYAVITDLDKQIGRIITTLKEIGEYENTVIIFSSDQGLALGSHGLMGKQNLYEHTMGVPLIFSGPDIPKGKSSDAFVYLFDVYPTLCEMVGARIPDSLEGKSLLPIIRGKTNKIRGTIFLAYKDIQRGIRKGQWKMIRYPYINKTQLFNLRSDPYEMNDLAQKSAYSKHIDELLKLMAEQQILYGDTQSLIIDFPKSAEVDIEFFKKNSPWTEAK
jgi:arylsulfatase A-like enzyme